ncbi:MAG: amidohydrolase family protein [Candidatus Binatia bacterium]|nr:amidohydrolase family protein [Candidatus Binatia bacterium]
MEKFDLVIRGGTLVDGTGGDPVEGDVAIQGGVIAEIGKVAGQGREEIDARDLLVTPGFVDIHTHYDGQAVWGPRLTPSSWHGVTTVVTGNCGVGFAPCRPNDHDLLVKLMEGVEDIPAVVLAEGLDWSWESFGEFLDRLETQPHDIDFATQAPHGAIRVYAMGERGADREPATPDDIAVMARLAREAVEAGALGFTTSRTLNHRSSDGRPTPTLTAEEDELLGIAMALKDSGRGVLQVVSDFADAKAEFGMLRRLVEQSGRPLSMSIVQDDRRPNQWRDLISWIGEATDAGLPMKGQVCGRPVGIVLGLECTLNPFLLHAAYREIGRLPLAEKVARMRDPEVRRSILGEKPSAENGFLHNMLTNFERIFELGDPPNYEPRVEDSIAGKAQAAGLAPIEWVYDRFLENDGHTLLYLPFLNYADKSLEPSLEMMKHADTVLGLGDGGAHLGTISDASFPTTMLTFWTRDRTRGDKLSVPFVVRAHTHETAAAVGLRDRGLLARGYKADVNLIDYDALTLRPPHVVHDLPSGGRRLVQTAEGYRATLVSGQVIYRDGQPTDALPGKLIRGAQSRPVT